LNPATWTHEVTQTATTDPTVSFKSVQITPGAVSNSTKIDLTIGRIIVGDSPSDVLPPPAAPTVSEAVGISINGFIAKWSASSGATKYYLDVATDIGFTTYVPGFQDLDVLTAVSKLVAGTFTPDTTIYYRVRAFNSNGTSVNSATQEVVITSAPVVSVPDVTNTAPSGGVSWTSGPGWDPNIPISTNTATVTFSNFLTGNLVATNDSAGNFVLNAISNSITGTGSLTYTGGTFQFVANGSNNPTLTFASNALVQTFSNNIQVDAELKVSQAGSTASNSILAGPISGVGGIYKSGNGNVYVTRNDNTFDGVTTVGAGQLNVLNLGNTGSPSSLGRNATISLGSGTNTGTLRWESVASETSDKSIVLSGSTGGGTLDVRGTANILTLNGPISTGTNAGTRNFTLTGQGGATVNGLISGNAGLRVNGSSSRTVTLANANNSFGGAVTIDGNIASTHYKVQVAAVGIAGSSSPLGTNKNINIGSAVANSWNYLIWSNTVPETTDKTINLAGTVGSALIANKGPALLKFTAPVTATGVGTKTFYPDQDDVNGVTEFAGNIPNSSGGTTALNKNGPGTLILSAANTFTGGFTLKGGTLELRNAQSLAAGNVLTLANNGTGSDRVKVAYTGAGSDLGNLLIQTNGTIDLGTDNTAQIRFGTATGWAAGKILSVTNSSGGGKLFILDTNNVVLSQIQSVENPNLPAFLDRNGLLIFTANTAPTITSDGTFSVSENSTAVIPAVAATDSEANTLTYTIASGADADKFSIDSATGILTFNSPPDFENPTDVGADNVYNLTIVVSDDLVDVKKDIAVTVTDVVEGTTLNTWLAGTPSSDALLLQYAFGAVSPTQPLSQIYLPQGGVSGDRLVLTYYVRQGTFGLNVVPEVSESLAAVGAGFAPSVTIIDTPHQTTQVGGVELQCRTASVLIESGKPKKFLHLKVTQD
jgi:autotransporter-associated beta strand protein